MMAVLRMAHFVTKAPIDGTNQAVVGIKYVKIYGKTDPESEV